MSNIHYYKFEHEFIQAIMLGEPEVVRGALAGAIKSCPTADFARALYPRLLDACDPVSNFREMLEGLKPA